MDAVDMDDADPELTGTVVPGTAKDAVLRLFDAIATGRLELIDGLVSDDFIDHGAPPGLVPPGPGGYRTVLGMLRTAMEMRWELLRVVAEDDWVAVWVRNSGRHTGDFLGNPPTGREFGFEAMHFYRSREGVLQEHFAVRDDLSLFRQLGLASVT